MNKNKSIILFTNIITPYRTPLFYELSKIFTLKVVFLQKKDVKRKWSQNEENLDFNYEILNSKNIFGSKIILPKLFKLFSLISSSSTIIFIDNPPNFLSLISSFFLSKLLNKKFILWSSVTSNYFYGSKNSFLTRVIKVIIIKLAKYSHSVISYGFEAQSFLLKNNVSSKKIFYGTQVHPQSLIASKGHSYVTNQKKIDILCVSYLSRRKRVGTLIEAFNNIDYDNIILNIIGTGDYEEEIINATKINKKIKYHGYKDGSQKYEFFKKTDILVFPTSMDVWGLVINEAIAFNIPVLVSNKSDAANELVIDNGFIYESLDIVDLKNKLEILINDKDMRYQFSNNSKKIKNRISLKNSISTFQSAIYYVNNK